MLFYIDDDGKTVFMSEKELDEEMNKPITTLQFPDDDECIRIEKEDEDVEKEDEDVPMEMGIPNDGRKEDQRAGDVSRDAAEQKESSKNSPEMSEEKARMEQEKEKPTMDTINRKRPFPGSSNAPNF